MQNVPQMENEGFITVCPLVVIILSLVLTFLILKENQDLQFMFFLKSDLVYLIRLAKMSQQ